jgi:23S rRNA (adenine1618-N6)-methyltransferase
MNLGKSRLHSRNKNRERYNLSELTIANPQLSPYVKPNRYGDESIDFANPAAVKVLNRSLLNYYYGIKYWEFPDENLCPPVPGRADYIHHLADLLSEDNYGIIPRGELITCLDIGVGASCIYPIIGVTEYAWRFIGSDIDLKSIEAAQNIVDSNSLLIDKIIFRLQKHSMNIFYGILGKEEKIDVSMCNPPFHASTEEAQNQNQRKVKNLSVKNGKTHDLNFAGMSHELICDGGEHRFIHNMIEESKAFSENCLWFTSLVSKQSNLKGIYRSLKDIEAHQIKTIPMGTGNKSSRIVAWTFLSKEHRKDWRETRWKSKAPK